MKIQYQFVNGESREIEVADELGAVLLDLDRIEYNNNQTETRRHTSLDGMDFEGGLFVAPDDTEQAAELRADLSALARAMAALSADQRALLQKVYFEGRSIADIAREEGVARQSIHERMERIKNKLKVFFT